MPAGGETIADPAVAIQPPVATLRLSVTDRCNLRCAYCMPAEGVRWQPRETLLPLEELADTVAWLHGRRPLRKIKITGGEPLLRRGLPTLIAALADLPGRPEVSITSNGSRLAPLAEQLARAGLSRVSVSLDTLHPGRYRQLTRGGDVAPVLAGIDRAREVGLAPVKLNSVLRRTGFREDVPALLDLAAERDLLPRFIELMRTGTERAWSEREQVPADEVRDWLDSLATCTLVGRPRRRGSAPARSETILWRGEPLEIGWILPRSRPFCGACDRLRLDARGRLRRCLMDPDTLDVGALRAGSADPDRRLGAYLERKRAPRSMTHALPMASLGG